MGICEGRVCIVTGAGRGIGRAHALLLAAQGARVVVNDLGGAGGDPRGPAHDVVAEIQALGGEAVANGENVADFDGAKRLIDQAIETYGRLDVLVNNAGIIRDRMLTNMSEQEWDSVINVHLKGTFAPSRHAAAYWREQSKAGQPTDARIINTSSPSGLYGNRGQSNYGAAKAGLAAFTLIAAKELRAYGVTANAIAPTALTRMTENLGLTETADDDREQLAPEAIAPLVSWLASVHSSGVTGRVFDVTGKALSVVEGWQRGPTADNPPREPDRLGPIVQRLVADARPNANILGYVKTERVAR